MRAAHIVIVGAGPTGLGCARELAAAGETSFEVLEAADRPGGLASSVVDEHGFTWDLGGHVVFSHYGEFDRMLGEVMGADLLHHERSSFVHVAGRWVPYPFQSNLHHLPDALAREALDGLRAARGGDTSDFAGWMRATFGDGIVRQFMRPYNEKVWAWPPEAMSADWIADRVAVVSWQAVCEAFEDRRDVVGWGPNNLFAFPASGGTGEIYRRAAEPLREHLCYRTAATQVHAGDHVVSTTTGDRRYDHLVWTGPLDVLVRAVVDAPPDVVAAADQLVHNSVTMVGVGYQAPLTDDRSWLYFPEPDVPFYRATNFAKYSPANVPDGRTDRFCSWMTEVASSPRRPLRRKGLEQRVDAALRRVGLVADDTPVVGIHVEHVEYGYPVPTLDRDRALAVIQPWLMARDIYARGRFGAWRYELGNMDHAVKMGVDVARLLVAGTPEVAWS